MIIKRITDSRDRITITCFFCKQTAQKILLIRSRDSDQKMGIFNSRFLLNGIAGTVSDYSHHIKIIGDILNNVRIPVNDRHIMTFLDKLFGNGTSDLTTSYNYDSHVASSNLLIFPNSL